MNYTLYNTLIASIHAGAVASAMAIIK